MKITVVGAGVIGLSCALRLCEAGHDVHVVARDFSPNTTSNVAAAVWFPYLAYPFDLVTRWGKITFDECVRLAADPASGIIMREVYDLREAVIAAPWWHDAVPHVGHAMAEELPPQYPDGFVISAPVIEMDRYLPYLHQRVLALGATFEQRELHSFDELDADILVNCSGLGARELAHDDAVFPIRGQIIRTTRMNIEKVWIDDAEISHGPVSYIIPRSDDCVLGGVAEEHNWSLDVDPAIATAIFARCCGLEPRLQTAEILQHRVGLRPGRATIRLERETVNGQTIIHNYGHGGAGVTLSWGCAADVVSLM